MCERQAQVAYSERIPGAAQMVVHYDECARKAWMRRSLARDPTFDIEVEASRMSETIKLDAQAALRLTQMHGQNGGNDNTHRKQGRDMKQEARNTYISWQNTSAGYGKAQHGKGLWKGDQGTPYQAKGAGKAGKNTTGNERPAVVPKGGGKK
jgi:hypothetical protein